MDHIQSTPVFNPVFLHRIWYTYVKCNVSLLLIVALFHHMTTYQAITWPNVDFSLDRFCCNQMGSAQATILYDEFEKFQTFKITNSTVSDWMYLLVDKNLIK